MSERIWAVIDGNVITNTIVADDAFVALIAPEHDAIVEITDVAPRPAVHWAVHPDGYRPPQPFASWVWDGGAWTAPAPMPSDGDWSWDETAQEWIDTTPPEA